MNISRISGTQGVAHVRPNAAPARSGAENLAPARDEMNLSGAAQTATLNGAAGTEDIRFDLVNRVRAEIEAGTYYSDEKFQVAIERMFDSFE